MEPIALAHQQKITDKVWIDCSCGWKCNHPNDEHGKPDKDHIHNQGPWADHVAAEFAAAFLEDEE